MTPTVDAQEYERRIREAAETGTPPPDIVPPADYEMSPQFREWLVTRMRGDVLGQVRAGGLDRMAIVKVPDGSRADGSRVLDEEEPGEEE